MNQSVDPTHLRLIAQTLGIGRARRHIFLCALASNPKCASQEASGEVWVYLKRRILELGLDGQAVAMGASTGLDGRCVQRSKVDCLRVCQGGPIAVVYPDGVWYHSVTTEVMERILQEHVMGDRPVEDHVFARDPLTP